MSFLSSLPGILAAQPLLSTLGLLLIVAVLGFSGASFWAWVVVAALALGGFGAPLWGWVVLGAVVLLFGVKPLRRLLLSGPIVRTVKAMKLTLFPCTTLFRSGRASCRERV